MKEYVDFQWGIGGGYCGGQWGGGDGKGGGGVQINKYSVARHTRTSHQGSSIAQYSVFNL